MAVSSFSKGFKFKKPSLGFRGKVSLVVLLGISFVVFWSLFSSPPSSLDSQRSSFGDIEHEVGGKKDPFPTQHVPTNRYPKKGRNNAPPPPMKKGKEVHIEKKGPMEGKIGNGGTGRMETVDGTVDKGVKEEVDEESEKESASSEEMDGGMEDDADEEMLEEKENEKVRRDRKYFKRTGPLFSPTSQYNWRTCTGRRGQNYIPCIDLEGTSSGKLLSHRHHERSCPLVQPMCLTPLPQGYESPVPWPLSQQKIFYRNVAHPMLLAFIKTRSWLQLSDELLTFPMNESVYKGDASKYLDFIGEMVPDIDWGKNIRVVLDIGCSDASLAVALLEKDALVLSLGLMNDQTDLAQVSLERGIPAVVGNLGRNRLPFPSGVFDAIHCGECDIPWHSNGGKLILEMNRILRPGGYFITSFRHGDIQDEQAITKLTANICWSILAHNTDEETDLSVRVYQRPSSNNVYELRMTKDPPICGEAENKDAAWYVPIQKCLHTIPAAIEQRGTDWPEEWPKRLEKFPEWLDASHDKLIAESEHWKAIVNNSYLKGMGIDWSSIRNVMDMKAGNGGFAAALMSQKIWVMNVIPIDAPETLSIIFERGLIGTYHDWCEPFSTYPRSYDLLHADHVFTHIKNGCRQPVGIVIEMDRILRPGGWAIIRDKVEIVNPLETILRSLHWDIRMTYSQNNQGIICAQKSMWRP